MSAPSPPAELHPADHRDREPQRTSQKQARVGVITPSYNAEAFVEDTIASVDAQTFTDWIHVVVNDGSTDRTAAVLDPYANNGPRRQVVHQANRGHAITRNHAAARLADTVDYLLFLDADDTLDPRALETAVEYLDQHPDVAAVHWRFEVVDETGTPLPGHFKNEWHRRHVPTRFGVQVLPDTAPETPLRAVITHCGMIPSCMLMRQSAFADTAGFNESTLEAGLSDVDLFIRLALRAPIHRVPVTLSQYRVHANQVTADIRKMDRQYERLLRRWRRRALRDAPKSKRLQRALLFAECRKPTSDRLYAAASEWRVGAYGTAVRVWVGAVGRYLWSLLPSRVAAPLYLKLRAVIEQRNGS
jgi:glycosyltransferase involved in cell wall biosynthesis